MVDICNQKENLDPTQVKLLTMGFRIPIEELSSSDTSLCIAIVVQAVLDYRDLTDKGLSSMEDKCGKRSKREIGAFFRSEWGEFLLRAIGGHYTPSYIYKLVRSRDNEQPEVMKCLLKKLKSLSFQPTSATSVKWLKMRGLITNGTLEK